MHDLVIRGGTIVDGTGATARSGDVAVDGGVIAAVGEAAGPGRREIDADGAVVTVPADERAREDGAAAEVLSKHAEWFSGVLLVVTREKVSILVGSLDAFLIEDVLVGGTSG